MGEELAAVRGLALVLTCALLAGCIAGPAAVVVPMYTAIAGVGVAAAGVAVAGVSACKAEKGCNDIPVPP
jgi:hypothetical protein